MRYVVQSPEECRKCADPYSNLNDNLRHGFVPSICMRVSAPKPASATPRTSLNFKIDASISFYSLSSFKEINAAFHPKTVIGLQFQRAFAMFRSARSSPNRRRLLEYLKELAIFPTGPVELVGKKPRALRKGACFRLIDPTKVDRRKASGN